MPENFENIESPIDDILRNNPELEKIYGDRSVIHETTPDKSGNLERDGQKYNDNPKIRAFIELGDAIRDILPDVDKENVRLWRGNRKDEVGCNPSYTNSLDGIALPFLSDYNGVLSYIDVLKDEAEKYLTENGATGSEFILPKKVLENIKIVGFSEEDSEKIKKEAKPLSQNKEESGWDNI